MQSELLEKMCELAGEIGRLRYKIAQLKAAILKNATAIDIPLEKAQMN